MSAQNRRDLAFGRRGGGWSDADASAVIRPCGECGRPMLGGQRHRHGVCSPRLPCCGAYTDLVPDLDQARRSPCGDGRPQIMTTPGYATVATTYHQRGWHPLPIPRGEKSSPPAGTTGRDGKDPTTDDIASWAALDAHANIALRMPAGVIGIDVDDYDGKGGAGTLADLEARYGPLPATWSSTSRGPDQPSRIYFLRCPVDLELPGTLGPGIEAIQRHHRYAVAAPSTRRDTGGRYRWYHPDGSKATTPPAVAELPELPATWAQGLAVRPRATDGHNGTPAPATAPRGPLADDDSIAERINRDNDWHTLLNADGWTEHHRAGDDTHWTRPGKDTRLGTSAVLHEPDGPFVVFTTGVAELQQAWATNNGDSWAYSLFGYLAATRYAGNRSQLAREARLADNTRKLSNAPLRLTEQRPPRRTTKPCPHCGSTNTSEKQSNT